MDRLSSGKNNRSAKLKLPDYFESMVAVWGIMGIGVIWLHLTKKAARAYMVLASGAIGNYKVVYDGLPTGAKGSAETVETEVESSEEGYDTVHQLESAQ